MALTDRLLLLQVFSASSRVFDFWEEKSLQLGEIKSLGLVGFFFSLIFVAVEIRLKNNLRSEPHHSFVIFPGGV